MKKINALLAFHACFKCEYVRLIQHALYPQKLNDLSKKYTKLGVPLIAISSTDTVTYEEDSFSNMFEKARSENFKFLYLHDNTQVVAKDFKADKTPHAFNIWKENGAWIVKYNGAIDDNGYEPKKVTKPFLAATGLITIGRNMKNVFVKDISIKSLAKIKNEKRFNHYFLPCYTCSFCP